MLILVRKQDQRVIIDDHIVLTIVGIENNRVRIGIEAPANVRILREELLSKKKVDRSCLNPLPAPE